MIDRFTGTGQGAVLAEGAARLVADEVRDQRGGLPCVPVAMPHLRQLAVAQVEVGVPVEIVLGDGSGQGEALVGLVHPGDDHALQIVVAAEEAAAQKVAEPMQGLLAAQDHLVEVGARSLHRRAGEPELLRLVGVDLEPVTR